METVTRFAERQAGSVSAIPTPGPEVARTLSVTASYLLSEDGRKASLLAGGDGRAVQQIPLQVPANRLHLVSVDKQGVARLKLRPRFERDSERGVVRIDASPIYDAPPTVDELYRAAAKNHELESAYYAERVAERSKRSDADRARRESVAEAFFADKGQRAIAHPPPIAQAVLHRHGARSRAVRCRDRPGTREGRATGGTPALPRGSQSEGGTQSSRPIAEQLALHEEKKRFIAEWVAANGTDEQKVRQAAGVLPMAEAIEGITDQEFAVDGRLPLYSRDGAERLQTFLRESCGLVETVVGAVRRRGAQQPRREGDRRAVGGCPGHPETGAGRERGSSRARPVVEAT